MLREKRCQKTDAKRLELQRRFVNREVTKMRSDRGKKRTPHGRPRDASRRPGQPGGGARPGPAAPKPPSGGHFLWGRHAVLAALGNPERRIAALYATDEAAPAIEAALAALPASRRDELPPVQETDRRRLDALHPADGDKAVHQGMLAAVWPLEAPDLEEFLATAGDGPLCLLLLDQLSDPRNVGAVLRSGLALGAQAVVATHRNAPEETGALARAAAGALEHLPLVRVVNLARAIERLQQADIMVAGLAADGDMTVGQFAEIERLGIVLGAEGAGLRQLTRKHCDSLVRIEISPHSESLNVSVAGAIALHAAARHRYR